MSFKRKKSAAVRTCLCIHTATGQVLARTEKKQSTNKSNFAQSTDAPNGNMKPEPDQSIFSQKTCSFIMLILLAQ